MREVDLLITSSSRPQLFPFCWRSFKEYVHFRGQLRVIVHEDFVFRAQSTEVMDYLLKLKERGEIHEIYHHDRAIGLGRALDEMIRKRVRSDYMFYLQEDWEFERPIDLDQLLWVMDNNREVNLIALNKYRNTRTLNGICQPQHSYNGVDMILYAGWTFLPGLWRMSHVKKYWRVRANRPEGYFTNSFGSGKKRSNNEYCKKVIGAYFLGKIGEPRFVRHLGNDWRMAKWRLENGKPGGRHDPSRMDYPYRAEWLPSLPPRPVQNKGQGDDGAR